VFMRNGQIQNVETLREALARPDSPLFDDAGAASVLEGTLGEAGEDNARPFGPPEARLWLTSSAPAAGMDRTRISILSRDVSLSLVDPQHISIQNHLPVTIERIDPPRDNRCVVACRTADGQLLLAEITARAVQQLRLATGKQVYALIKSVALLA